LPLHAHLSVCKDASQKEEVDSGRPFSRHVSVVLADGLERSAREAAIVDLSTARNQSLETGGLSGGIDLM
jgi:hypothetical protein